MIISKKHKFIFIHNPKCAGHSIRKALQDYHDSEIKFWDHEYNPVLDRIVDKAHLWGKDVQLYEPLDFDQFFVFGFARNPYDRFKSAFNQYRFMNPENESLDINDFSERFINEVSIRFDWNLIHFCPQYLFFYKGNKRLADFVGRQERLAEDLVFISSVLGFHIEHFETNKTPTEGRAEPVLTSKTLNLINRLYERDFILFEYPMVDSESDDAEKTSVSYRERINRVYPSIANTVKSLDAQYQQLKTDQSENLQKLGNVETDLRHTRSQLEQTQSELEQALSRVQHSQEDLDQTKKLLQSLESELEKVKTQLSEVKTASIDLQNELTDLYGSKSWRYMKPFRALFSLFK